MEYLKSQFFKMKIIQFSTLCFLLLFTHCIIERPLTTKKSENNPTYTVEYLFEHDGCKVYRFRDDGHYVYFTSCKGETTSVISDSTGTKYIKSNNSRQ